MLSLPQAYSRAHTPNGVTASRTTDGWVFCADLEGQHWPVICVPTAKPGDGPFPKAAACGLLAHLHAAADLLSRV